MCYVTPDLSYDQEVQDKKGENNTWDGKTHTEFNDDVQWYRIYLGGIFSCESYDRKPRDEEEMRWEVAKREIQNAKKKTSVLETLRK